MTPDQTKAKIVEALKLRFPEPWFNRWYVRTYYNLDRYGKETDEPVACQAFVKFLGAEYEYHVTLVLVSLAEILATVESIPLPAAGREEQEYLRMLKWPGSTRGLYQKLTARIRELEAVLAALPVGDQRWIEMLFACERAFEALNEELAALAAKEKL